MAHAHIPDCHDFGSRSEPLVEIQVSFLSSKAAISPFVDRLVSFIVASRGTDGSEIDIEVALLEALTNAVVHGNHEDTTKPVDVICRCSAQGTISITIRDRGKGFDPNAVPDPTAEENRMSTRGRGIYLMRALMDEVWFEEHGTVVHMRKKAAPPRPRVSDPMRNR